MHTMHVDVDTQLCLLAREHASALHRLIQANQQHLARHLDWVQYVHTETDTRVLIDRRVAAFARGESYPALVIHRGEVVGAAQLEVRGGLSRHGEIGYWLGQASTGQGIMTRCVQALTTFALGTLGLPRVVIHCAEDNPSSCAIPERLGYTYEGTLRADAFHDDQPVDFRVYALLAGEAAPAGSRPDFAWQIDQDLALRIMLPRHAEAIYRLAEANRAHLRPWLTWVDQQQPQDTQAFIDQSLQRYADNNGCAYGIWFRGELAGAVDYHFWDFRHRKTEIGYWLGQAFTGHGLMTRCVRALTDHAIHTLALNRVVIRCAVGNERSCAVPERLGYTLEMVQRQAARLYDQHVDMNVYAVLAADWPVQGEPSGR